MSDREHHRSTSGRQLGVGWRISAHEVRNAPASPIARAGQRQAVEEGGAGMAGRQLAGAAVGELGGRGQRRAWSTSALPSPIHSCGSPG